MRRSFVSALPSRLNHGIHFRESDSRLGLPSRLKPLIGQSLCVHALSLHPHVHPDLFQASIPLRAPVASGPTVATCGGLDPHTSYSAAEGPVYR